jgi:hypothetical protein
MRKTRLVDFAARAVVILSMTAAVLILFYMWSTTPVVIKQYATGDCLMVLFSDDQYSCELLPSRYETEWRN